MKLHKSPIILLTMILLLSLFLAACASEPDENGNTDTDDSNGNTEETEGNGEAAGGGDLIVAKQSDIVSLDPAGSNDVPSSDLQNNIYESLTKLDENMEVQPSLATSWEPVEDNVWEFKLREGVKFHDGSDFNADVVKANIERIQNPDVASARAFLYEMVTDIEVVDEYTVRFTTEYPFAPLPAHLAHTGGSMVALDQINADLEAMENGGEPGSVINENPIGTGYFKFEEWKPGESVTIVRNDDYWDEPAKLDSVTFKVVSEGLTRVAELETGTSHISDPISPNDVAQVEAMDGVGVHTQESVSLSYIGFNATKEPFNDPKVRQALNMAIDKSQIIDGIYEGIGIPATGPLAPTVFGYDDSVTGLEYDPDEARNLLEEAGYADGFSTTLWTNDNPERVDAATNIQAQLEGFGIEVEIQVLEWGAYLERTANGEHDMFILGWSTATGDADYGLYGIFHSDNIGEPGNRTFTEDAELDELLQQAREESDETARLALYTEIQEKLNEIAPMLYLHHQEFLVGVSDKVQGFSQLPTQILQLKDVTLEQ